MELMLIHNKPNLVAAQQTQAKPAVKYIHHYLRLLIEVSMLSI